MIASVFIVTIKAQNTTGWTASEVTFSRSTEQKRLECGAC